MNDNSWLSSFCPCAGVPVVVEPGELAAVLPVVVAVTALVELAGVLTDTIEGAGLAELAGVVVEVAAGAGPGELAESPPGVGGVSGLGELTGGLPGTVAGVAPAEPVAAPLPPVKNWSTALAMSWNKLAINVNNWLSSFCPCCGAAEVAEPVELVAVLPELAEGAEVGAESGALLEVVARVGLVTAVGAATAVGGAAELDETAETLLEAAPAWLGPFEPAGWVASCS
jgi:hypothetical protein